jgi:CheY-like chemotaxis protein
LIVFSDVTERKRTEEALRQNERLASLGRLLAGVAHELNNPLSVIIGHAALLRRHLPAGPTLTRAEKIEAAAERCARIVANFLTLARQRPPRRAPTDLNRMLRETVDLLAYQLNVDDIAVMLELADDVPLVWTDVDQMQQVALNLVVNAQHAMRTTAGPRRLTVTSRYDPRRQRVAFAVADTGPGVPPELRLRIFEPFFTTKDVGMGSGLGLSLCRGIVEAHRGSIEVRGRDGEGAVFVVELPVTDEGDSAIPEPALAAREIVRGKRILVVDDEPLVAEVLAEMLAADDHEVTIAPNGAVALEKISADRFDLVITDIKMPDLDGPGLYRALALGDAGLRQRLVFITGDTLSTETRQFVEMTGAPRLVKPFDVETVRRVVQAALGTPRV